MKCTKCGKNEVNFFYKSNINGEVTEHRLCTECAEEMGLMQDVFARSRNFMSSFFEDSFERIAMPFMHSARNFLGRTNGESERKECSCKSCDTEKRDADPELNRRREINALRNQMKIAADAEDFEKAAEIRDRIRSLEG